MKISVIGSGYVGLVTATCLASLEHRVVCVDVDPKKVNEIQDGNPPIFEPMLNSYLQSAIAKNYLKATTDLLDAVLNTDVSFIAVGTPFDGVNIDLQFIRQVSKDIGHILRQKDGYHLVIVKSTVVPGTTDDVVASILEEVSGKSLGTDFGVAMNPEFLREGSAVNDFLYPDRIILGVNDTKSREILDQLYDVFPNTSKIHVNCKTAEMIKYTSNSFFASLISFSNEIANLCSASKNVDTQKVFEGLICDKRISPIMPSGERIYPEMTSYLKPGCGFGGSCFPKDVKSLITYAKTLSQDMQVLDSVIAVNNSQPMQMINLMARHFQDFNDLRVGILGLSFKPGTDDIRESPAIDLVKRLLNFNCNVSAYDPVVKGDRVKQLTGLEFTSYSSLDSIICNVDCLMLVTAWDEFIHLPSKMMRIVNPPLLIDGRGLFSKEIVPHYERIGY